MPFMSERESESTQEFGRYPSGSVQIGDCEEAKRGSRHGREIRRYRRHGSKTAPVTDYRAPEAAETVLYKPSGASRLTMSDGTKIRPLQQPAHDRIRFNLFLNLENHHCRPAATVER